MRADWSVLSAGYNIQCPELDPPTGGLWLLGASEYRLQKFIPKVDDELSLDNVLTHDKNYKPLYDDYLL